MNSKDKKGLEQWLSTMGHEPENAREFQKLWELTEAYKQHYQPDAEKGLTRFQQQITLTNKSGKILPLKNPARWLRIAAAVIILIGSGLILKNYLSEAPAQQVANTEANQYKAITLHDGSKVTLNSNSILQFPEKFDGKRRRVRLQGEGFFEVAKDAAAPFFVETEQATVQVTGTSFNIRCYGEENTLEVFVKTGSVAVVPKKDGTKRYDLKPGDHLLLDKNSTEPRLLTDEAGNSLAWKERVLKFRNTPLNEVLFHLERLYKIRFEVKNKSLLDCPYTTTVSINRLQEVLKVLETSFSLTIKEFAAGEYLVTGGKCPDKQQ